MITRYDRQLSSGESAINVMSIILSTRVNGPGNRTCVWLQGCPIGCKGCFNPQSWANIDAGVMLPSAVASLVLGVAGVEGVTFSGGEPMSQPLAMLDVLTQLHKHSHDGSIECRLPLGVICFSGYSLEEIEAEPDCAELLRYIDLLVAGPYVEALKSDVGIGGSTNKTFWYNPAPGRGKDIINPASVEFDRGVEVHLLENGSVAVTGFPPSRLGSLARVGVKRALPVKDDRRGLDDSR